MYRLIRTSLAVLTMAAMLAGPVSAAPAAPPVGNGTPLSCDENALNTALAIGGAITFNCGGPKTIQLTSVKTITQTTTLSGGDVITLTGDLTTRLFRVNSGASLTLQGIALDSAFINGSDGGAISNAGTLVLDDARISNGLTDDNHGGGAIFTSGPVSIHNSRLFNNSAGMGGAIYALGAAAQVVIDNTSVNSNHAINGGNAIGGGIWLGAASQLTATDTLLNSNTAQGGGALYLSPDARATLLSDGLSPASLSFNTAQYFGGAIFNEVGQVTLSGVDLSHNQTTTDTLAIGYGGAVYDGGWMVVNNSTFNSNQGRFGGAVFVGGNLANAQADIQHTHFTGNVAAQFGGALYTNVATTTVTIEDSSFEYNTAAYGGGIARTDAHLSISRSSITNNTAQNGGGLGLQALPQPDSAGYVEIHDSTISGNLSTNRLGGGINNSGLLDLVNVTLANNRVSPDTAQAAPTVSHDAGLFDARAGTIARLQNSVLDNRGGLNCSDDGSAAAPTSAGYNYSTDTSCGLSGFHDTEGSALNAMLGPLTNAGSFTSYQPPLAGSPLINQAGPGCSATDQRHAQRSGPCDIGAIEFGGLLPRLFVPLLLR